VFEGVEGCGKTTQLQRTWEWLQGERVLLSLVNRAEQSWACAYGSLLLPVGKPIQSGAEGVVIWAQHVEEVLNPRLAQGNVRSLR